jgi:hypothetical protein
MGVGMVRRKRARAERERYSGRGIAEEAGIGAAVFSVGGEKEWSGAVWAEEKSEVCVYGKELNASFGMEERGERGRT